MEKKKVYGIEDIQCPHCLASLVNEEDRVVLLFDRYITISDQTKALERGMIQLSKEYRNYNLWVYGIHQFSPGELVIFYCPHCRRNLMVQDEYFYFLVRYVYRKIDYAFMSARFGHRFTILADVEVAKKILQHNIDLAIYEAIDAKVDREEREAIIHYYVNRETLLP